MIVSRLGISCCNVRVGAGCHCLPDVPCSASTLYLLWWNALVHIPAVLVVVRFVWLKREIHNSLMMICVEEENFLTSLIIIIMQRDVMTIPNAMIIAKIINLANTKLSPALLLHGARGTNTKWMPQTFHLMQSRTAIYTAFRERETERRCGNNVAW